MAKFSSSYTLFFNDKAFPALQRVLGGIREMEAETEQSTAALAELGNKAPGDVRKLGQALQRAENDLRKLKAVGGPEEAIREARAEVERLDAALREAGGRRSIGQLQTQARALRRAMKGAFSDAEAQQLESQLAGVEAELRDLRGEADKTGGSLAQALSGAGAGIGQSLGGMGMGAMNMAALANPYTAAAAGATALVAGTGALIRSLGEAGAAIARTSQELEKLYPEARKQDLDRAAGHIHTLANVFDQETGEIQKSASALSQAFNTDINESLALMEQSMLALGNKGDMSELIDQAKEYGVHLKDAGFSQENMLALLVQSANKGIYSDKGLDAVKEFRLRISEIGENKAVQDALRGAFGDQFLADMIKGIDDGSIKVKDALKIITTEMNKTGLSTTKLQTVVADVFGGPGEDVGLDFLKTLGQGNMELEAMIDNGNALTVKQREMLAAQRELNEEQRKFGETWKELQPTLDLLWARMKTGFASFLAGAIEGTSTLSDKIKGLFGDEAAAARAARKAQENYVKLIEETEGKDLSSMQAENRRLALSRLDDTGRKFLEQRRTLGDNAPATIAEMLDRSTKGGLDRRFNAMKAMLGEGETKPGIDPESTTTGGGGTGNASTHSNMTTVGIEARRPTSITFERVDVTTNVYPANMEMGAEEAGDIVNRAMAQALNEAGETT